MSRVWGETAFAQRSGAMKAPVGLLSGSAVCDSRWRGVAPTSATPTRSLRKCRRIEEVKSRMDRKFSRIENLWPRDGSCLSLFRPKQKYRFQTGSRFPKLGVQVPIEVSPIAGSPLAPNLRSCPCVAAALSGSPAFCAGSWSGIQIQTACAVFKVRV